MFGVFSFADAVTLEMLCFDKRNNISASPSFALDALRRISPDEGAVTAAAVISPLEERVAESIGAIDEEVIAELVVAAETDDAEEFLAGTAPAADTVGAEIEAASFANFSHLES